MQEFVCERCGTNPQYKNTVLCKECHKDWGFLEAVDRIYEEKQTQGGN